MNTPKRTYGAFAITMPKQREYVKSFFKGVGIEMISEIVPGVNRSLLNVTDLVKKGMVNQYYEVSGEDNSHSIVAELATTFAHGRAVRHFLQSKADFGIIFEDDVRLVSKDIIERIPGGKVAGFLGALDTMLDHIPEDFDELNLGRCVSECMRQSLTARLSPNAFLVQSRYQYCSSSYVISRKGAEKLNKWLHTNVASSNDYIKVMGFEKGEYEQYSLAPRMFEQNDRCGVNSCGDVIECVNAPTNDDWMCGCKVFNATSDTESILHCDRKAK
uniref:Uncharacterized protein n=2 Tax=Lotharella globosa TaxID=91324 RepID=A0A7S3YCS7_9EUKA